MSTADQPLSSSAVVDGDNGDNGEPLSELLDALAEKLAAGGFGATVVPASGQSPRQLVYPINSVDDRHLGINTYFMPGIANPSVLQHFVALPYSIRSTAASDVVQFVGVVNTNLPLTGFEFDAHSAVAVFRHTHAIGVELLNPDVIAWTWAMIAQAVQDFGPLVERVGAGGSLRTALDELRDRLAQLVTD